MSGKEEMDMKVVCGAEIEALRLKIKRYLGKKCQTLL